MQTLRRKFGWVGTMLLLLIVLVKVFRWTEQSAVTTMLIGIAPSILGPAGLLFLLRSSTGKLSRFTLLQVMLVAGVISLGLEFAQLLPRPGILARVNYTFDWLDVVASMVSLDVGYWVARRLERAT